MKRGDLLRHLRKHGCYLKREGAAHSLWCNPATGVVEAPHHVEIATRLAAKMCCALSLAEIGQVIFTRNPT
ncbi:MAG: addiction module toxin, HicA family [Pseudomonadota bacterium]|nr:addiction module toxin, HicA family [Burkholderiales bacterium]MDQ3196501.1 addiction module toxin, HicA family [Pseudomonadota bacterium]